MKALCWQDASELRCYAMFKKYGGGQAYFDNFRVWTSQSAHADCDSMGGLFVACVTCLMVMCEARLSASHKHQIDTLK